MLEGRMLMIMVKANAMIAIEMAISIRVKARLAE